MSSTRRIYPPARLLLDLINQGLFQRALTPPVALDDRSLERLRPKLRHLQPDLAGLDLQLALIVAGAVRLGFQQRQSAKILAIPDALSWLGTSVGLLLALLRF